MLVNWIFDSYSTYSVYSLLVMNRFGEKQEAKLSLG